MKLTLTALLVLCVSVVLAACGGGRSASTTPANTNTTVAATDSGSTTVRASGSARDAGGYLKEDGDPDADDRGHAPKGANDDQRLFAIYGKPASPPVARTISALVKSYYRVSSAGDAQRACKLLSASLLAGLTPARGTGGCATTLAPLLAGQHRRLLEDHVATMVVIRVLVKGRIGLAVVGFKAMPESDIVLAREDDAWKIDALFDSLVP